MPHLLDRKWVVFLGVGGGASHPNDNNILFCFRFGQTGGGKMGGRGVTIVKIESPIKNSQRQATLICR